MIGRPPGRSKWWLRAMISTAAIAAVFLLAWRAFRISELAEIGAGYVAEQTCACVFISRRTIESCRTDLVPLAQWVVFVHSTRAEVTANAFGAARATARYDQDFGCTLED